MYVLIDLPYSDISKCSQPTQLRNWDDLNQHVEDFSDTAWAILFRNMIPKSTSITQNLMKLHVHRSVNLTRSNFVLLCDLIPELRSLVSLSYMGGIEKKEDDHFTPLTLGLEKKDDHTLTFEEKEDDAEDDDDTLAVGRALGRMIRNSSNLVTLTLPTLGLSETLEFSKGIFHTSSLKNLSFSIRPDRDYEILYFNISQENSMVRFKDLPEAYQMSIRRGMNSTLFETMRNIANSRGLCDVRGVRAHVSTCRSMA